LGYTLNHYFINESWLRLAIFLEEGKVVESLRLDSVETVIPTPHMENFLYQDTPKLGTFQRVTDIFMEKIWL
jgi:hypothetical protein